MSEAGKNTETNAIQTSAEEESHPVLIPGMDIFNRASSSPFRSLVGTDIQTLEVNPSHGSLHLIHALFHLLLHHQ
jgi:hypothetical protein